MSSTSGRGLIGVIIGEPLDFANLKVGTCSFDLTTSYYTNFKYQKVIYSYTPSVAIELQGDKSIVV